MGKAGTVNLILHFPKTGQGQRELARRVAQIHADTVSRRIGHLACPASQKLRLLDAVIDTASQQPVIPDMEPLKGSRDETADGEPAPALRLP